MEMWYYRTSANERCRSRAAPTKPKKLCVLVAELEGWGAQLKWGNHLSYKPQVLDGALQDLLLQCPRNVILSALNLRL